uniref:Putative ring finger n=1 Tax=Culex tarsalis TaxID=7177 RepID=A0A1Q3FH72_CULTA
MSLQAIFGVVTSLVVGVAVAFGIYAVVSQNQNRPHQYPAGSSSSGGRSQPRPSGGRRSSRARQGAPGNSQWQGYSSDDDVVCSICMEKVEENEADNRPIKLRCGHLFHDNCIAPWVPNQKCPNCRKQM